MASESPREAHLRAAFTAQLRLADVSAALFNARDALSVFDEDLLAAVGPEPGTDPGSRAAESTALLKETIEDADRLCRSINDLLQQYRKGI